MVRAMIRPYTDADLDDVLDVWYEASVIAHAFLPADFFPDERVQLAERWLPQAETYVAEVDGRVVGFLSIVGDEIGGLFVHPDHQGAGVGRALVDHVRSSRATLELDVFEENEIGRRFYAAYGFEHVRTHRDEQTGHVLHRLRLVPG